MTSKVEPVTRGGAGGADRTSTVTAGPACAHQPVQRFTFAVRWPKGTRAQARRAAAVAEHLDAEPGAVVADEWENEGRLFITVAVQPKVTLGDAMRIVKGCPESVADTLAVER